jgi:C4-dicarboxylate transporter DctQ subunit
MVFLQISDERDGHGTFYVIIPIGFGLACIQYIRTVIKNFTEKEAWQSPDQQSEYEDEEIGGATI